MSFLFLIGLCSLAMDLFCGEYDEKKPRPRRKPQKKYNPDREFWNWYDATHR